MRIEDLFDTCQEGIDLFNEEIDDFNNSVSIFQEALKEFSNELTELFKTFVSICEDAEKEDISMKELLTVLRFIDKLQGFKKPLSKPKKKTPKLASVGSMDSLRLYAPDYEQLFPEDDEIPFI